MNYYVLNSEKVCIGVSSLSGAVVQPNMIETKDIDFNNLGKVYNYETMTFEDKVVE
jgi:hypothetical protein